MEGAEERGEEGGGDEVWVSGDGGDGEGMDEPMGYCWIVDVDCRLWYESRIT